MFDTQIADASIVYSVPESWIKAVIKVESNWDPTAFNISDPGGAYGLMQITGQTAQRYNVTNLVSLFNADVNIDLGTHILMDLRNSYGTDPKRIYSAYNSGNPDAWETSAEVAANVQRFMDALEQYGGTGLQMSSTMLIVAGVALLFLLRR